MPLIYRSMYNAGGKPETGPTGKALGARPSDIAVDANGNVRPGTGGMSVTPAWRLMAGLPHLVPRRLRSMIPGASGPNRLAIWRMGQGPFIAGPVAGKLALRPDPSKPLVHGFVEPDQEMTFADLQDALGATRDQWTIDET